MARLDSVPAVIDPITIFARKTAHFRLLRQVATSVIDPTI
jgi:hypothetical protein